MRFLSLGLKELGVKHSFKGPNSFEVSRNYKVDLPCTKQEERMVFSYANQKNKFVQESRVAK